MSRFRIAGRTLGDGGAVFLIAEAGVNHNGRLDYALRLVDLAARAGADAVKFQTFRARDMIVPGVEKARYQKVSSGAGESQTRMLERLEIGPDFHRALIRRCRERSILFLSTPYDEASLELLVRLGVPALKVSSTDATNLPFLALVARTRKPVILSTGMCRLAEVRRACQVLRKNGCRELAVLKCTSEYPADPRTVNLAALSVLKREFPRAVIGFSDHTPGVDVSRLAVAAGARVVEKHFTLDRGLPGPDHRASLSPRQLAEWVRGIRACEAVLGTGILRPTAQETEGRRLLRKYCVLARPVRAGDRVCPGDLTAKRTGGRGVPAEKTDSLAGRRYRRDLQAGAVVSASDFSPGARG